MLTPEQLDAIASAHSGLAEVVIQEWAILLRCRAGCPVATAELVLSLIQWFGAPLSAGELTRYLGRLVEREWLAPIDNGRSYRTTELGRAVLAQTEPPLARAALWSLVSSAETTGEAS